MLPAVAGLSEPLCHGELLVRCQVRIADEDDLVFVQCVTDLLELGITASDQFSATDNGANCGRHAIDLN